MAAWDEILLTASIGPIDGSGEKLEFPVRTRTVTGGRMGASRRYPYRNGQDYEDTGQEPLSLQFTVELYEDVDPSHYPSLFFDLIDFLDGDEALGQAELIDPELGPLPVRMMPWRWSSSAENRNGGVLDLAFETIGEEGAILYVDDSLYTPTAQADIAAANVDQQIADSNISAETIDDAFDEYDVALTAAEIRAGLNMPARWSNLLARYKSTVTSPVSSTNVATSVDIMRRRIEAMQSVSVDLSPDEAFPIISNCNVLMGAVTDIGQEAFQDSPRVIEVEVERDSSIYEVAVQRFNDVNYSDILIDLNPTVPTNFIPAGTIIIVPLL